MTTNVAPSCRTGGARQLGEPSQAPVAAAIVLWLRTSLTPFPSCRTRFGGDRLIDPLSQSPLGGTGSPKVPRKEASL